MHQQHDPTVLIKVRLCSWQSSASWLVVCEAIFAVYVQEAFPVRFRGIHHVREPPFFDVVFAIIKQFWKEKILKRVSVSTGCVYVCVYHYRWACMCVCEHVCECVCLCACIRSLHLPPIDCVNLAFKQLDYQTILERKDAEKSKLVHCMCITISGHVCVFVSMFVNVYVCAHASEVSICRPLAV